tara:strand:+ start:902 stop:1177 length:276 start_codon:yes stop_codon:yes gene_type:complete
MKKTFNLFLISISIILITLIVAAYWDDLQFGENKIPLAMSITVAFGISIAGLIIGISELKKTKTTKSIIGIIGHIVILLFFFGIVGYSMTL